MYLKNILELKHLITEYFFDKKVVLKCFFFLNNK